jgi:putative lysine transport system permease protein
MLKALQKGFWFILLFGFIVTFIPNNIILAEDEVPTDHPLIQDAIENIRFYSSFNYQTLTEDKLSRLTSDFYLPVLYNDVTIQYTIESDYISLSSETEVIELYSGNVEVYKATVLKTPSVLQGDQLITIHATFTYQDNVVETNYQGILVPVIPDDFFGGFLYTLITYGSMFLEGALRTLGLALAGTVIGFFLALFIATGKIIKASEESKPSTKILYRAINRISSLYITIFRGTPMIVQASFFWYGFGLFGDPLLCGLFVVSLNTAAYIAEIIRGGIQSIDPGQSEGGLSLGLSYAQTMIFIIIPQAIKNTMPAIGNEFVINIKDTAVLSVIGIFELFNQTRKITGMHYRQLEAYAIVALIYLFLTYTTTSLLRQIELKMDMKPVDLVSSN